MTGAQFFYRRVGLGVLAAGAVIAASGCGSAARPGLTTTPEVREPRSSALPRIHEGFTLLPCPRSIAQRGTTLGIEGCQEHRIVRTDAAIRVRELAAVALLGGVARREFALAERDWLAYRHASCEALASKYSGGSEAPVAFGGCIATANRAHLGSLAALLRTFRQH